MTKDAVIIPAYNEEGAIVGLLKNDPLTKIKHF